jgi:hypothetical protein
MENGTKSKIKNILNHRRPVFWITIAIVVIAMAVGVCLLVDLILDHFPQPVDLILPLKNEAEIKQFSQENKAFFIANQERLECIALYLENTQDKFETRPVALHLSTMDLISKVSDLSIRQEIIDLLQQGEVKFIVSGLDDARVQFVLEEDSTENEYSQGFYHVAAGTPDVFNEGETNRNVYNQIHRYEKLTENWYEFIYALAEIKDADKYRLAAWNHLGADGQKIITTEWSQARVTLVDWENVGHKEDKTDREFVVCVQFMHKNIGVLGMITLYFDPVTLKYVGTEFLL